MAGGNLSPRQKMINMMYLVLTALLALNVSREVMDAFYEVMQSQEASIETVEKQNTSIYAAFDAAAAENPVKAGPWRDKANEVKSRSAALFQQIVDLKKGVIDLAGGPDEESGDPNKPLQMDNLAAAPQFFIQQGNGKELKEALANYRDFMKGNVPDNELLSKAIEGKFDLSDHKVDGTVMSWENHNFEHFPLISVINFLTKLQSDIRTSEANVIDHLQKNISASDLKFTGVRTVVMPKSTFVTKGDQYEADVFLAAYDDTQNPIVTINGQELSKEDIVGGVAKVRFPANRVGETTWNGEIKLLQNGEEKVFPVEGSFNVAPPAVVISPTKMNVLYRGVDNPLEISVPGVDPANLIVKGYGVRKSGSGYIADVTKASGKEMTINVSVKDGDVIKNMGGKKFRIKGLPPGQGSIYKKTGDISSPLAKGLVKNATIEASFSEGFAFDLPITVKSFEIFVDKPYPCKGNKLSDAAKAAIDRARPGERVTITDIKGATAKTKVRDIAPIIIKLN